jgi:pyrimidine operon attenuation protein/uracil phosphoribosyltransferase
MEKNYILDRETIGKKFYRMAYEIMEENFDTNHMYLVGIKENGVVIARNVKEILDRISEIKTEIIELSMDKQHPSEISLSSSPDFNNANIIIIDDVSNSGKTMLYALKPFLEAQPKKIQTLVLIDRSHKKFPVHNDYVGLSIATTLQEHIYVEVHGEDVVGAWME